MQSPQSKFISPKEEEIPLPGNIELLAIAKKEEAKFNALMLKDKDLVDEATRGGIRFNMFWDKMHQALFKAVAKYWASHQSLITRNGLESILDQNDGLSEDVKAKYRLMYDDLYQYNVTADDFSVLREGIEGRDIQRKVLHIVKKYENLHSAKAGIKKQIEAFQREIAGVRGLDSDTIIKTKSLGEALIEDVWPEIQQRAEHPESFRGIMSGFTCIDGVFNGFLPGKYLIFSGRPNGGKTTVMLNMACNMAFSNYKTIFVTIEDDLVKCSKRALTIQSEINFNRIQKGGTDEHTGLAPHIMANLKKEMDLITSEGGMGEKLFFIETLPDTKWSTIVGDINRIMSYTDIDVLFVDYLDVVGREISHPTRPDLELADVSKKIQSFGKRHNILAATAQQLRSDKVRDLQKKGMNASNFKVGVGDISGTQQIAAAADYIFGLWMDEDNHDRMHLFSTKSRHTKALDKFMLSIDCNSGRMKDAPTDFESIETYAMEHKTTMADQAQQAMSEVTKTTIDVVAHKPLEGYGKTFAPVGDVFPFCDANV